MKKPIASHRAALVSIAVAIALAMACGLSSTLDATEAPPAAIGNNTADLARATVQILALVRSDGGFQPVWTGSGSVIAAQGLILTNSHVVDDRYGDYDVLGVALTDRTDQPPTLTYLAEIAAVDYGIDLAVIRVVSDPDGNPVEPHLPFIQLADSDQVEIGDDLRILGYPGIGGETITFTEGAVSGFSSERGVEGRAWIKTDATIAGGNSGGMGVNVDGLLVGVPTRASAGANDGEIVDCRPVVDTNRDGVIDDQDTCVPIGGFINGLRPANLAQPLITAALNGQEYVVGTGPAAASGSFDVNSVVLSNLVFSDGVTPDDQPAGEREFLDAGAPALCAFWDYEGMADGVSWSAYWFGNGELDEARSFINDAWEGGESGNWWVCMTSDKGLDSGLYELALEVEGTVFLTDSIYVGGDRRLVEFALQNSSSIPICYVNLSPTDAQNWGQDKLRSDEILDAGATKVFQVASGTYDLKLSDCDYQSLLEDYSLDVSDDFTYTVTD